MNIAYKTFASTLVLGVLLAGCGGGSDSPNPSQINASATVSLATPAALNGVYTTSNLSLSSVEKRNPIGGDPEVCTFRFSGLQQAGSDRVISGDIRYIPGAGAGLHVAFIAIAGVEYSSRTTDGVQVDKPNNTVRFSAKTFPASSGNGDTITLTGNIPMLPESRPEGC